MTLYCVSYDLVNPNRDYLKIESVLKKYSNNFHSLGSVWFVESEKKASEIRDELEKATDEDDKVFVVKVIKHWATINIVGIPDWLRNK